MNQSDGVLNSFDIHQEYGFVVSFSPVQARYIDCRQQPVNSPFLYLVTFIFQMKIFFYIFVYFLSNKPHFDINHNFWQNSLFFVAYKPIFCISVYMPLKIFLTCITSPKKNKGRIKQFLISLIVISGLGLTSQLTFQIVLLANPPYANQNILPNCTFKQEILEEFGFSR